MKWFKHDCDASTDSKIRKLIKKFGMEGYGFFFLILELMGRKLEKDLDQIGFLPDEWDIEALEMESGLSPDTIGTLSDYFLKLGLFEKKDGKLFNKKLIERCDEYTQKLINLQSSGHKLPIVSRQTPDSIPIVSRADKIRLNEIKLNNKDSEVFSEKKLRCPLGNGEAHKSCLHLIDLIAQEKKTKFPNYAKQINGLHKSLRAGFKLDDIEDMAAQLIQDSFYKDAGWDLMTIANELGKKGQLNA